MSIRLGTTQSLKLVTGAAKTLDVLVGWFDGSVPDSQETLISTATTTEICAAPGAGVRDIDFVNVVNRDAAAGAVTLQKYDTSGSKTTVLRQTISLAAGYTLTYTHRGAWGLFDDQGRPVSLTTAAGAPLSSGKLWLGDGSNLAAEVALSGDVTLDNAGVATLTALGYSKLSSAATLSLQRRNTIINGNFNVWQRGTSFSSASGQYIYTADRWAIFQNAAAQTVSQETSILPNGTVGRCLKVANTTADSSMTGTKLVGLQQIIEGQNALPLYSNSVTVSFWVRSSKTGTYSISLRNGSVNRCYIAEYTVNSANTWEKKYVTLTFDSTGTWATDSSIGIMVMFTLMCGPTIQTAANTWTAGNYTASSNQVNWADSNTATFYISQVQLEPGTSATNFEYVDAATELARCQRYYWQSLYSDYGSVSIDIGGCVTAAMYVAPTVLTCPVPMRAKPTVSIVGTWGYTNCDTLAITAGSNRHLIMTLRAAAAGKYEVANSSTPADGITVSAEL